MSELVDEVETLTRKQCMEIAYECGKSSKLFAKTFFPDVFHLPFSKELHDPIFDLMDNCDAPRIVIKAPRGIGKSSVVNYLLPIMKIVYRQTNFLLQGSASVPLAEADSEAVKDALMQNELLKKVFGSFRPEARSDDFSKKKWVTTPKEAGERTAGHPGTLVVPTSWKQKIRGQKHTTPLGLFRPDFIIVDDLEDSKEVHSDAIREKMLHWFMSDLKYVVQRRRGPHEFPWKWWVIGTFLHDDGIIQRLCDDDTWLSVELAICDENTFESHWPEFMTTEEIKEDYRSHANQGTTHIWSQEMLGEALDPKTAKFQDDYFIPYETKELEGKLLESVVLIDPAKTLEEYSSDTAIVGWSFCRDENLLYLRDIVVGALHPSDMIEEAFKMAVALSTGYSRCVIGYEVTGLNLYITWPLQNYNIEKGYNFELVELVATGHKDDRIMSLAPLYKQGRIRHLKTISAPLELQLKRMPKSARKDVADAASYIVQMMGKGGKFFRSQSPLSRVEFNKRMSHLKRDVYSRFKPIRQRLQF